MFWGSVVMLLLLGRGAGGGGGGGVWGCGVFFQSSVLNLEQERGGCVFEEERNGCVFIVFVTAPNPPLCCTHRHLLPVFCSVAFVNTVVKMCQQTVHVATFSHFDLFPYIFIFFFLFTPPPPPPPFLLLLCRCWVCFHLFKYGQCV